MGCQKIARMLNCMGEKQAEVSRLFQIIQDSITIGVLSFQLISY